MSWKGNKKYETLALYIGGPNTGKTSNVLNNFLENNEEKTHPTDMLWQVDKNNILHMEFGGYSLDDECKDKDLLDLTDAIKEANCFVYVFSIDKKLSDKGNEGYLRENNKIFERVFNDLIVGDVPIVVIGVSETGDSGARKVTQKEGLNFTKGLHSNAKYFEIRQYQTREDVDEVYDHILSVCIGDICDRGDSLPVADDVGVTGDSCLSVELHETISLSLSTQGDAADGDVLNVTSYESEWLHCKYSTMNLVVGASKTGKTTKLLNTFFEAEGEIGETDITYQVDNVGILHIEFGGYSIGDDPEEDIGDLVNATNEATCCVFVFSVDRELNDTENGGYLREKNKVFKGVFSGVFNGGVPLVVVGISETGKSASRQVTFKEGVDFANELNSNALYFEICEHDDSKEADIVYNCIRTLCGVNGNRFSSKNVLPEQISATVPKIDCFPTSVPSCIPAIPITPLV